MNTFNKIESRIILLYHGIEKGLLHERIKYRFGRDKIVELINLLKKPEVIDNREKSQIASAYLAICTYYELHQNGKVNISDYYTEDDYTRFKHLNTLEENEICEHAINEYFGYTNENFIKFAKSRSSVRDFSGELVPLHKIHEVIELAKTAPSVCNRQPTKVYYIEGESLIDEILRLQKGLLGFSNEIKQILVLVTDRNYFYRVGERNQMYIDGGIFLMNLLYALHYYEIGACPAHWAFNRGMDKNIKRLLKLSDSEKVISLISIGIPKERFRTTLSFRRSSEEILKIINKP